MIQPKELQSSQCRLQTKKSHLHDCFGSKYDDLIQEGKKLTETAPQQIQSAVLSWNTRGLEARDITELQKQAEVDRALRHMLPTSLDYFLPGLTPVHLR